MRIKPTKVKPLQLPEEPKGGKNSNNVLLSYLAKEFQRKQGTNLQEAAEKAKVELSSSAKTDNNSPYLPIDSSGPKHMNVKLSRAKFGKFIGHLIKKTIDPCVKATKDVNTGEMTQGGCPRSRTPSKRSMVAGPL